MPLPSAAGSALCVEETKVETDCKRRSSNLSNGGLMSFLEPPCDEVKGTEPGRALLVPSPEGVPLLVEGVVARAGSPGGGVFAVAPGVGLLLEAM